MKRLLVLMMCAMLAVQSVGMNVEAKTVSANQLELTSVEAAEETVDELNDYYIYLEFTNTEKTRANGIMKAAGQKLGYDFNSKTGKLVKSTKYKLVFSTVDMIEDYKGKIKSQLDGCKTKAPVATPEPEVDNNSNIIIGGKEYDTTTANAGQYCEIAVPLVNLGETDVTNVVITPELSGDVTSWPFDIERTDYSQVCD